MRKVSDYKRHRKIISLMLVMLIVFSYCQTLIFADSIDNASVVEEAVDSDSNDDSIDQYKFDEDTFKQLISIMTDSFDNRNKDYKKLVNEGKIAIAPIRKVGDMENGITKFDSNEFDLTEQLEFGLIDIVMKDVETYSSDYCENASELLQTKRINSSGLNASSLVLHSVRDVFDDSYMYIDNYGNIVTNDLDIVLPFYLNDMLLNLPDSYIVSENDLEFLTDDDLKELSTLFTDNKKDNVYLNTKYKTMTDILVQDTMNVSFFDVYKVSQLIEGLSTDKTIRLVENDLMSRIKKHSDYFVSRMEEQISSNNEKYSQFKTGSVNDNEASIVNMNNESVEELVDDLKRDPIDFLLDGGANLLMKRTIGTEIVESYESNIINFSATSFFLKTYLEIEQLKTAHSYSQHWYMFVVILIFILSLFIEWFKGLLSDSELYSRFRNSIVFVVIAVTFFYSANLVEYSNIILSKINRNDVERMAVMERWHKSSKTDFNDFMMNSYFTQGKVTHYKDVRDNIMIEFDTTVYTDREKALHNIKKIEGKYVDNDRVEYEISKMSDLKMSYTVRFTDLIDFVKDDSSSNLNSYLYKLDAEKYQFLNKNQEYDRQQLNEFEYLVRLKTDDRNDYKTIPVRKSDLVKLVFKHFDEDKFNNRETENTNDNVEGLSGSPFNRLKLTMYSMYDMTDGEQANFLDDVSSMYDVRKEAEYSNSRYSDQYSTANGLMESINYGDLLNIESIIIDLFESNNTSLSDVDYSESIESIVYSVNRKMINMYMDNYDQFDKYVTQHSREGYEQEFDEALDDVIKLKISSYVLRELTEGQSDVEFNVIDSSIDALFRVSFIPYSVYNPSNPYIFNYAVFATLYYDYLALFLFAIMLFIIVAINFVKAIAFGGFLFFVALVLYLYHFLFSVDGEDVEVMKGFYNTLVRVQLHTAVMLFTIRICSVITNRISLNQATFPASVTILLMIVVSCLACYIILWKMTVKAIIDDPMQLGMSSYDRQNNAIKQTFKNHMNKASNKMLGTLGVRSLANEGIGNVNVASNNPILNTDSDNHKTNQGLLDSANNVHTPVDLNKILTKTNSSVLSSNSSVLSSNSSNNINDYVNSLTGHNSSNSIFTNNSDDSVGYVENKRMRDINTATVRGFDVSDNQISLNGFKSKSDLFATSDLLSNVLNEGEYTVDEAERKIIVSSDMSELDDLNTRINDYMSSMNNVNMDSFNDYFDVRQLDDHDLRKSKAYSQVYNSYSEASRVLDELRQQGYRDATTVEQPHLRNADGSMSYVISTREAVDGYTTKNNLNTVIDSEDTRHTLSELGEGYIRGSNSRLIATNLSDDSKKVLNSYNEDFNKIQSKSNHVNKNSFNGLSANSVDSITRNHGLKNGVDYYTNRNGELKVLNDEKAQVIAKVLDDKRDAVKKFEGVKTSDIKVEEIDISQNKYLLNNNKEKYRVVETTLSSNELVNELRHNIDRGANELFSNLKRSGTTVSQSGSGGVVFTVNKGEFSNYNLKDAVKQTVEQKMRDDRK